MVLRYIDVEITQTNHPTIFAHVVVGGERKDHPRGFYFAFYYCFLQFEMFYYIWVETLAFYLFWFFLAFGLGLLWFLLIPQQNLVELPEGFRVDRDLNRFKINLCLGENKRFPDGVSFILDLKKMSVALIDSISPDNRNICFQFL